MNDAIIIFAKMSEHIKKVNTDRLKSERESVFLSVHISSASLPDIHRNGRVQLQ